VYVGTEGRIWFVAAQDSPADNIYVYEPSDAGKPNHSRGFSGQSLMFETVEGEELSVKAPWHSNARALFRDTGVDVRRKHRTFVVIANERDHEGGRTILRGIICRDEQPRIGPFDRGSWDAQGIANVMGRHVFCYSESSNGSSCGPVFPIDGGEFGYYNEEGQEDYPEESHNQYIRQMDKEGRWQGNPKHPKYPWRKEGS
jgi:hypothetical protein